MSNIVKFRPAEYVNIHGKPLTVSMKKLVLELCPGVAVEHRTTSAKAGESNEGHPRDWFIVRAPVDYDRQALTERGSIGSGGTEEAAWRDAYFALVPPEHA